MALELLVAGQRVSVSNLGGVATPGVYRVVRSLPKEGRPQQYCIKSEAEAFERIVDENRLEVLALT